jgi:hypothetical protein
MLIDFNQIEAMTALQEPAIGAPAVELTGCNAGLLRLRDGDYPVFVCCAAKVFVDTELRNFCNFQALERSVFL